MAESVGVRRHSGNQLVSLIPIEFEPMREPPKHCPTHGCNAELVDRVGGRWCPRCRGWLIFRHKPDGRLLAWIDLVIARR